MKFRDAFYFLSNMYPAAIKVTYQGKEYTFSCVESAFQALKCPERIEEFVLLDGYKAKRLGRRVQLRPDWEDVKRSIMLRLVGEKFAQHPELLTKLHAVKGEIVEDNDWNDTYWGVCNGIGENHLGQILMKIRDRL